MIIKMIFCLPSILILLISCSLAKLDYENVGEMMFDSVIKDGKTPGFQYIIFNSNKILLEKK